MSDESSPRSRGFAYGIGWGKEPKPPAYLTGLLLERLLLKRAAIMSHAAWKQQMLVRGVRLAETDKEKASAVTMLEVANDLLLNESKQRVREMDEFARLIAAVCG